MVDVEITNCPACGEPWDATTTRCTKCGKNLWSLREAKRAVAMEDALAEVTAQRDALVKAAKRACEVLDACEPLDERVTVRDIEFAFSDLSVALASCGEGGGNG